MKLDKNLMNIIINYLLKFSSLISLFVVNNLKLINFVKIHKKEMLTAENFDFLDPILIQKFTKPIILN